MPQLDKFMFITQLFWLCVFFFSFYFYILNYIIPKIFKVLRFRQFKLENFISNNYKVDLEEFLVVNSYTIFLKKSGFYNSKMLINLEKNYFTWINNIKKNF